MAEWDEVAGFFCGLDGGNTCNTEYVPFSRTAAFYQLQSGVLHLDAPGCNGKPMSRLFGGHVHHVRLTLVIEMRKFTHT